jgi:hypothetical protein
MAEVPTAQVRKPGTRGVDSLVREAAAGSRLAAMPRAAAADTNNARSPLCSNSATLDCRCRGIAVPSAMAPDSAR